MIMPPDVTDKILVLDDVHVPEPTLADSDSVVPSQMLSTPAIVPATGREEMLITCAAVSPLCLLPHQLTRW